MTDILLDTSTHDLVVENYDLVLVSGVDLFRQRVKQRLLFFLGEWYLAIDEGVPYFEEILIKAPNRARVESIFKRTIMETEGAAELQAFSLDYQSSLRDLTLSFQVRTDAGDVVAMEIGGVA